MEPDMADPWDMDARAVRPFEGIRKRNTCQLVALALQSGFLRQFLVAALPGNPGRIQHALQRVTWNTELFAVIGQQIVKGFLAVIDAVLGILLDLADSPIPDSSKLKQPSLKLLFLRRIEAKFQLPLDHLTPVSDFRCIA